MAGIDNLVPFKPGYDERRGSKPKGSKHINTYIQELMVDPNFEARILDPKLGIKEYKGAPIHAVLQVVLTKAVNGDQKMIDMLFKYGWAQKQEIDQTISGQLDTSPANPEMVAKFTEFLKGDTKQ